MIYTNLQESPDYYADTISLIENAFGYDKENSFEIDFYPLMRQENRKNCFIIVEDNKVIAHIAALEKSISIKDESFPFTMYGGIAVDESVRGKGYFKELFQKVLTHFQESSLHLLWSEKIEMYEKFSFYPCSQQFTYSHNLEDDFSYENTSFTDLSEKDLLRISDIYNHSSEIRVDRTLEDWKVLKNIKSTDLYIKRVNEEIENYFFINKGADLIQVIHEIGNFSDFETIRKYGVVWAPYESQDVIDSLYATNLKIGSLTKFKSFITHITNGLIIINEISKDEIQFNFENTEYQLTVPDFLTGVLGPGRFEELEKCSPLYISGLDSI